MRPSRVIPFDDGRSSAHVYSAATASELPGRPTFVLLAGIGMSHRSFRRLFAPLAEAGTVHAIDLPGSGRSRRPQRRMTIRDNAEILASVIDELSTGPVVLVGHSMGAQFAVELSVQRPDLISHVVLIGPVVDPSRRTVLSQAAALALDTVREPPWINSVVFTDYLRCGIPWYRAQLTEMMTYAIAERIGRVRAPVLVLRGARDPVARAAWTTALASAARHGSIATIDRGAHVIQYRRPTETAACIRVFGAQPAQDQGSADDAIVEVDGHGTVRDGRNTESHTRLSA